MNHRLLIDSRLKLYRHLAITISLLILFAITLGLQGCGNRMAYKDRYVDTMRVSYAIGVGRSGYDKPNVRIAKLDFIPIDRNDYKLKWTGAAVRYSDCYHFKPIIELEEPAPKTFTREFDIVKNRTWPIADEMIGGFSVTFTQGSKVPSDDQIVYPSTLNSYSRAPIGTPDPVKGKFWMGCTQKKKIKANADKDGEQGDIYITLSPIMVPADGITIGGVGKSPEHRVRCVSLASGGSQSGICPANRPDCCWTYADGRCGECINMAADQVCQ